MTYAEYRVHCTEFGNYQMVSAVIKRGWMGSGRICIGFIDGDTFWHVDREGNRTGSSCVSRFVKKSIKPLVIPEYTSLVIPGVKR